MENSQAGRHCCCCCTRCTILQINTNNFDFPTVSYWEPARQAANKLHPHTYWEIHTHTATHVQSCVCVRRVTFSRRSIQIKLYFAACHFSLHTLGRHSLKLQIAGLITLPTLRLANERQLGLEQHEGSKQGRWATRQTDERAVHAIKELFCGISLHWQSD